MKEIWKDIKGYEGYYQASNLGRIKSLVFQNNVWNKKYKREKILKPKITKDNCSRVELWKDGKHKTYLTYRLVAFTFYGGDISNRKLTVDHLDGNRLNNNLNNLEIVSLKENIQRGYKNGLYNSTMKKIKLINKKTKEIIVFSNMAETSKYIGKSHSYISDNLKRGKNENKYYKWELL